MNDLNSIRPDATASGPQADLDTTDPNDLPTNPAPSLSAQGGLTLTAYLQAISQFLIRYVALPSINEEIAIVLWVAHTYLLDDFDTSPILAITSAEMQSARPDCSMF